MHLQEMLQSDSAWLRHARASEVSCFALLSFANVYMLDPELRIGVDT